MRNPTERKLNWKRCANERWWFPHFPYSVWKSIFHLDNFDIRKRHGKEAALHSGADLSLPIKLTSKVLNCYKVSLAFT